MLIERLRVDNLLSFPPGSKEIPLRNLNVVIGANGSGKSNLIEVLELLRATPTGFASAIRDGGGSREWVWKGNGNSPATLEARLVHPERGELRYKLSFGAVDSRTEITDEVLEQAEKERSDAQDVYFYYRFQNGHPALNVKGGPQRRLRREDLAADESVLFQRKDPDLYPELAWCSERFKRIQTFRDWSFGRYAALRQPQRADLPTDVLLPDATNLGLILNHIEHGDSSSLMMESLRRFLPRFQRLSTLVQAGTVQFFLHEDGLKSPIPSTRLSDGTIRFLAMLALLLMPNPPPLICMEEPELGLHPDAVSLIADLLVEASQRTQLLVTTHSDALVSALSDHVESVLVCEHRNGSDFVRLESDRLKHWLDRYRLGDLWRMGELGGNP